MKPIQIPNFGAVDAVRNIRRGGTPTPEAWKALKDDYHITQVIRLSTGHETNDGLALVNGLDVFPYPIPVFEQIALPPPRDYLMQIVRAIHDNTFVHCGSETRTQQWLHDHEDCDAGGNDRTGLIIGVYRVVRCGWGKDQAWAEMRRYHFHRILVGLYEAWLKFEP